MKFTIIIAAMALILCGGCAEVFGPGVPGGYQMAPSMSQQHEDFRMCQSKANAEISEGMTRQDVVATWGEPQAVNPALMVDADEVWFYPCGYKGIQVFYGNGRVVAALAVP